MLIAVTGDDEDNLVACQVAKHKFNVHRTIARIRNPQNEFLFKALGVNVTISSTNIILENIETEVPTHPLTHLLTFEDGGQEQEIVVVKIAADSATVGKPIREISLPAESKLLIDLREDGKTRVPTINTIIRGGDRIIAMVTPDSEEALRAALRGT
jgi:trk system potassium uptake protein TrkA